MASPDRPALVLVRCILPVVALTMPAPSRPGSEAGPGPRNAHAAVYDLRDSGIVLFGGATEAEVRGDTWRWKGGDWRRLPIAGPAPRTFPAMAYDSARAEVVLFGGNRVLFGDSTRPVALLGDTWVLRDGVWLRMAVEGPSPRAEAAVAYDSGRRTTVLFGGYHVSDSGARSRLGDTWEWDGRRWTRASVTGPSPRSGAAMAYDPGLGAVVLFGGSGGPLGDTWSWDGREWKRLAVPLAPGRFNTTMTLDPASRRLVRFGGWTGETRASDTWELHRGGWVRADDGGPAGRNHATLVSAPDRSSVLLYGGHDGDHVFGDLWERRHGGWVRLEAAGPLPRVPNGH
ncbi:MAG TPA: kelch repeat-containing protein [Gemmatimonadales bacterium]